MIVLQSSGEGAGMPVYGPWLAPGRAGKLCACPNIAHVPRGPSLEATWGTGLVGV